MLHSLKKVLRYGLILSIMILALLPLFNFLYILYFNGSNNITNDNLLIVPLFDQILSGAYKWENIFRDLFINGHFQFFTLLVQFGTAKLFEWNVYVLITVGIILAIIRIFLLFFSFNISSNFVIKILFLCFLSFLTFSTSQISTFEFDWNTIMINLCFFGIALGLWGLVRFPVGWLGIGIMAAGGVIASWTSASGIVAWLCFLLGMWHLGYRKIKYYIFWCSIGILISFPYFLFLFQEAKGNPYSTLVEKFSLFRLEFILSSIGLPLAQALSGPEAFWKGIAGLGLALSGLAILYFHRNNKKLIRQSTPAIILLSYSLLSIYQISLFRERQVPFYASYYMIFWVGLIGLGFIFCANIKSLSFSEKRGRYKRLNSVNGWVFTLAIIFLFSYFTSNLSFTDKSATLKNRSPISASCLRNYASAPTYCEKSVFNWLLQNYDDFRWLAAKLDKNHLSVFGAKQKWELQGDFILNNVEVDQKPGIPPVYWSEGLSAQAIPFSDFRHLNLFMHSPNSIRWTVQVPENIKDATLRSAVAISRNAPMDPQADGLTIDIGILRKDKAYKTLYRQHLNPEQRKWIPLSIPLEQFSGETITLIFSSDPGKNMLDDWAMVRFPHIDMQLKGRRFEKDQKEVITFAPSNTELSPYFPGPSDEDFDFNVGNKGNWSWVRMKPVQELGDHANTWTVQNDPILAYRPELDICLFDYRDIYVKMAGTPNWRNRELQVYYRLNDQDDFEEARSIKIPIISDGKSHAYTYNLTKMGISSDTHLTGIRLDPVLDQSSGNDLVQILDFRLIKKKQNTSCSKIASKNI